MQTDAVQVLQDLLADCNPFIEVVDARIEFSNEVVSGYQGVLEIIDSCSILCGWTSMPGSVHIHLPDYHPNIPGGPLVVGEYMLSNNESLHVAHMHGLEWMVSRMNLFQGCDDGVLLRKHLLVERRLRGCAAAARENGLQKMAYEVFWQDSKAGCGELRPVACRFAGFKRTGSG